MMTRLLSQNVMICTDQHVCLSCGVDVSTTGFNAIKHLHGCVREYAEQSDHAVYIALHAPGPCAMKTKPGMFASPRLLHAKGQ